MTTSTVQTTMENQVQRVEVEPEGVDHLPMPMWARIFLGGFGLLLIGVPGFGLLYYLVEAIAAGRWSEGLGLLGGLAVMTALGRPYIRTAIHGVDPDHRDRALAKVTSDAMLAAVERTGPTD